jgi:hypothetical protein
MRWWEEVLTVATTATTDTAVREVPKSMLEAIRVQRHEFRGKPYVDVRVFTVPVSEGLEGVPTKKGLTLRPETWRELLPLIEEALGAEGAGDEG